jgi:hypothetical protein
LLAQDGVFLEQLETDVGKYLPEVDESALAKDVVKVDLNKPMAQIRATLSQYPIRTRLSLSGMIHRQKGGEEWDGPGIELWMCWVQARWWWPVTSPTPSCSRGSRAARVSHHTNTEQKHGRSYIAQLPLWI